MEANFKILMRLRDDNDYYGSFGSKYLSNSNIKTLLKNPKTHGLPQEKSVEMLLGNYIHELTFNGESSVECVAASSRNTNIYKDAVKENGGLWVIIIGSRCIRKIIQITCGFEID